MFDIAVIGAGIAGVSAAARLAPGRSAVLLEAEERPGTHASGRSAALFTETYGNAVVRALTSASRSFLEAPPPGFADNPILTPRGALMIGTRAEADLLDEAASRAAALLPSVTRIEPEAARALCPVLRPDAVGGGGVHEPEARDIDTAALMAGFLRQFRAAGGVLQLGAGVERIERLAGGWRIATRSGEPVEAALLVDAAGAWADRVAMLAGLPPIGIRPHRRTAFLIDPPAGQAVGAWPMVLRVHEDLYFKPDAGRLLVSPADETASEPCDAAADEFDIALAADRLEATTFLAVRRIAARWAGLRSFAPDRTPVVGFDPGSDRFIWLAGQGGYGFQVSWALAELVASLVEGRDHRFAAALTPERFTLTEEGVQ